MTRPRRGWLIGKFTALSRPISGRNKRKAEKEKHDERETEKLNPNGWPADTTKGGVDGTKTGRGRRSRISVEYRYTARCYMEVVSPLR